MWSSFKFVDEKSQKQIAKALHHMRSSQGTDLLGANKRPVRDGDIPQGAVIRPRANIDARLGSKS